MPTSTLPAPQQDGAVHYVLNPVMGDTASAALFDHRTPQLHAQAVQSGGRNAAWFVQLPNQLQGVLRYYRRGGLIAKFIHKRYWWTGAARTRSWAEYAVMLHLHNEGVSVPRVLAAMYQRHGIAYEAAIIVEQIPHTLPLANCIHHASAEKVAATIKQMHDAGVWHADLNAYNVLLNEAGQVWLIDFDRAQQRTTVSAKQRRNNLLRLQRSLIKIHGDAGRQWWLELNQAYLQH